MGIRQTATDPAELWCLDGTSIRAARDGDGHPLHFHLSAGQVHDSAMLETVVVGAGHRLAPGQYASADEVIASLER